jgi:hypothetical protein
VASSDEIRGIDGLFPFRCGLASKAGLRHLSWNNSGSSTTPCVRLCPLAYVTGNKPCGSIWSPLERGAQVHKIKRGHMPVPDPCLGRDIPCLETLLWVARTILGGIWTPSKGPDTLIWESRTVFGGPSCAYSGPALPRGGLVQLIASWDISSFLVTWCPLSRPRGGVGCCSPCS